MRAAYGRTQELHGVSLQGDRGEAVTIIGANGSGKTTLLRIIAELMAPTAGTVRLGEADLTGRTAEHCVAAGIGLVPEGRQVFPGVSVHDNLLLGSYSRRRSADLEAELAETYRLFQQLSERRRQLAGTLFENPAVQAAYLEGAGREGGVEPAPQPPEGPPVDAPGAS